MSADGGKPTRWDKRARMGEREAVRWAARRVREELVVRTGAELDAGGGHRTLVGVRAGASDRLPGVEGDGFGRRFETVRPNGSSQADACVS